MSTAKKTAKDQWKATGVKTTGDRITLDRRQGVQPYEVALSRCDTHAKICDWVTYLGSKSWATARMLRAFVFHAEAANGLPHGDSQYEQMLRLRSQRRAQAKTVVGV